MFRHTSMYVRTDRIKKPEDLKGKKVGLPEYQLTANVWARAVLEDDFGVKPKDIHWIRGGIEHAQPLGHDLLTNAVAGNDRNAMFAHWSPLKNQRAILGGRTTRLTPVAVTAMPSTVTQVIASPNKNQAISAVVGGTRYIRLVTVAAAPR